MDNNNVSKYAPVFDDETHRITLPDGEWVDVLRLMTEGVEADALNAASGTYKTKAQNRKQRRGKEETTGDTEMSFQTGTYRLKVLEGVIIDWSFTRKDGTKIPVSPETIRRLPTPTRDFIMEEIDALNAAPDEEEQEDLRGDSSTSSTETESAPIAFASPTP